MNDKKMIDAKVADIAMRGKAVTDGKRVSSTAPPSPPPKAKGPDRVPAKAKAAGNASPEAKLPEPKKSDGETPGSQGKHVTIHIHNH